MSDDSGEEMAAYGFIALCVLLGLGVLPESTRNAILLFAAALVALVAIVLAGYWWNFHGRPWWNRREPVRYRQTRRKIKRISRQTVRTMRNLVKS